MSRRTQGLSRLLTRFRIRGLHPLRLHFPVHSPIAFSLLCRHPYNPGSRRFGLLRFRSPLLTESFLLSSPAGTQMFHFPASRLAFAMPALSCRRVPPFGHRRVSACLPLAVAFRRSLRPSSPLCA